MKYRPTSIGIVLFVKVWENNSSVATHGQPQSGLVMGIAKIRGEKMGVGGGTRSSWPNIVKNNYV